MSGNVAGLKPVHTSEEAKRRGANGGRKSAETRRRKAQFRKLLNQILTTPIDNPEWTPILKAAGIDPTIGAAINFAIIREALKGDVRAYEAIARYSGQSAATELDEAEQQIRIDRARQARNQEVGDTSGNEENIRNFLNAMKPSEEELKNLFSQEAEDGS